VVTTDDYMDRALFHAERGRGRTSPNPMVGAIIVSPDGVVVGHGTHERAGGPHAEIHALEMAGARSHGATLYCTLEPCNHTGRTGPCTARIVEAGIARVVAAVEDPNPHVRGHGFEYLRQHGIDVHVGVGAERAATLNQPFFTAMRAQRPFVILKAAVSLDGGIARRAGERTPLTGAIADRHAQRLRAEIDAIAVGVGTVLADDPRLTARDVYRSRPLTRVVFDRTLRTPPTAALFSTLDAGPVIIVAGVDASRNRARALSDRGADIEWAQRASLAHAMRRLGERGIQSLLLEGGARIHRAAWEEGLVDLVRLYMTPHTLGPDAVLFMEGRPLSTATLMNRHVEALGDDVLIEGYVHRPH
jgi:diaminohydroxyphosphoribosylaminopyrimidine deaminase/5-amino-6-(5-phosphoribosylamino)uracil reductase